MCLLYGVVHLACSGVFNQTKKGHFLSRNNPLCRERGSNPHAVKHWFLRPACLPIPPSRQVDKFICLLAFVQSPNMTLQH